ncbi:LRR receptor-like serine/threonine-protein kinase EFR [Morus notabilis]|uniref:non-specific serine/threonine protein kinase n=1 Tax=Morus notabilis TaxID=981085 RepID=W9R306_9ROSA|nr:LRR receptor-like serine/threonine-protein kinase EFR [Morus notabilis]
METGRPMRSTGLQADRSTGVHTTGRPVVLHCSVTGRPVHTEPATLNITTDKEALISFMSSLSSESSPNPISTWAKTESPCNWTGVLCDKQGQRVVGLDLSGLGLSGTISPHIGNLSSLHSLNLQNNHFTGAIPHEITKLFKLRVVNMSLNQIEGVLPPNISHCKELETLDLMENRITGKIPEEFSKLTRLEVLKLGKNRFYGEIPSSLANVSSLTTLNFGTNTLSGVIPDEFGRLRKLEELDITINNITGTIPNSIYNITSLVNLAVASNDLRGEIPYDVGDKLPNLLVFNFCFNKFTGRIPGSLHNLTRIRVIRVAHNLLEGNVPPGLGNLPFLEMYNIGFNRIVSSGEDGLSFITSLTNSSHLKFLAIDGNHLEGLIPESIGNLSKALSKLYMGGNRIHGDIPVSIGRLTSLTLLNLSSNLISGEIPTQIGELKELQMLGLANNKLSGAVPKSLGNLSKLNSIDLSGNSLLGHVPSSFRNFQSLLSMDLSNNKLNGSIPKECLNLPSLSTVLNLSNNFLSGPLPEEIGSLENVVTIDISNNLLSGQIPNSIKDCRSLEKLLLGNNRFFGPIPKGLAEIKGLERLDLSSNQLSGSIPEDLQELQGLEYLNLSFNNLEGVVPRDGVFRNLSSFHLEGNKKLCYLACGSDSHRKRVKKVILTASVPAILVMCFVVGLLLYLRKSKAQITEHVEVLDQEYGLGEKPSIAGDAYSFGVMLLELFTGMSPTHESFTADLNLPRWVQSFFPENLVQVLDSELLKLSGNVYNEGQSITSPEREYDCLTKVIEIGLSCTTDVPDGRLSLRLALHGLKTVKQNLLKQTIGITV